MQMEPGWGAQGARASQLLLPETEAPVQDDDDNSGDDTQGADGDDTLADDTLQTYF